MSRVVAFFDFDGTITTRDSLLEFIKYCKGERAFYVGFLLHAPFLLAYKLKILSNQRAKEMMLKYFFGKMPADRFSQYCSDFSREIMPSLIRPKAAQEINKFKAAGAEVVVVSASPEYWLKHWCQENGIKCIGTKLVLENNRLTGKIDGLNCYGEEKVRRIRNEYDLPTFSSVYCYGDTPGDRPMLALADYRFYKPFR